MNILFAGFFLYLLATIAFVVSISGKKKRTEQEFYQRRWGTVGFVLAILGVVCQILFIINRIRIGGHFPTSNMFEFIHFLSFCIALAFLVIYVLYKNRVIGAFAMPLVVILIAYAAVFPTEIEPLIPALRSHWLYIHVTTAALGQGALAVGAVSGLVYLLRTDQPDKHPKNSFWLEVVLVIVVMLIAFIGLVFLFSALGYEAEYENVVNEGTAEEATVVETYRIPPVVMPNDGKVMHSDSFLGMEMGWVEAPAWMQGKNAAVKLNSVLWSVVIGLILYGIIRLLVRRRISAALFGLVKGVDAELTEEISYRAIAIGYPLFTLGALIFAMIWAHEAWDRIWGWDPKEVWALITWLFYSAYLHLRLSRGWQGRKSAWLAVGGFTIIMINAIVINLVVVGLHAYA